MTGLDRFVCGIRVSKVLWRGGVPQLEVESSRYLVIEAKAGRQLELRLVPDLIRGNRCRSLAIG